MTTPDLHDTIEVLQDHMPTIVNGIALTRSIMNTALLEGEDEIAEVCRAWIGVMASLVKEAGLSDEYERVAREIVARKETASPVIE